MCAFVGPSIRLLLLWVVADDNDPRQLIQTTKSGRITNDFKNYHLAELHERRERMRKSAPTPLMLAVLNGHSDAVQVCVCVCVRA